MTRKNTSLPTNWLFAWPVLSLRYAEEMAPPVPGGGGGTTVDVPKLTPGGSVSSPSSSGGVHGIEGSEGGDGCAHTGAAIEISMLKDATRLARMTNVLYILIFLPP
jgi:hypothetical protein